MTLARTLTYAILTLPMLACAVDKADVDEDFSDLAGLDAKSDYFSYRLKLLGTLTDGDAKTVRYTKTPRFRGYDFTALPGESVDVWVRSSTGDALAWVLDGKFRVIAKNDDADDTTYDAHLAVVLPASGTTDHRYYVVFRDYDAASRTFHVSFAHAATAPTDAAWQRAAEDRIAQLVGDYAPLAAFAVPASAMPAAAKDRIAASAAVLEVPTTYTIDVDGRPVYLVLATDGSGEGNVVVADLIDGAGRWFAHGIGRSVWDGGGGLAWSLDSADPTMCRCTGTGASATATCTWMDGSTSPATELTCE